jgi:hypothetical protein
MYVCLKHTYCEDDTYTSALALLAASEGECDRANAKPDKSIHCVVESFTRVDSLASHTKLHSGARAQRSYFALVLALRARSGLRARQPP